MSNPISRRTFLKCTGASAVALGAAGLLGGCKQNGGDTIVDVKVGDKVNEGDIVCIVESMKVMNEIQADISGTVASIAVKDGEAVEFGQPLIIIE